MKLRTLKFFALDLLWIFGAIFIYGIPLFISASIVDQAILYFGFNPFALGFSVPIAYLVFILSLIGSVGLLSHLLPSVKTGTFSMGSSGALRFYLQHGTKCYITSTFLIHQIHHLSFLRTLYYKAVRTRYAPSAFVGIHSELHDPSLIEVGEKAFIGENTHVYGHMVIDGKLFIKRTQIGKGAMIGAHSLVGPGVIIGEGAQIAACSAVPARTRIGPGELWLGTPAKRVKRMSSVSHRCQALGGHPSS
jgi:acetyltransferase-like isoleucine patch superfamily enzyme